MEKTFKFISAMALIAAMCLSACNKVEITEAPIDEPGIEVTPSQGWKVAISATMGGAGTKALAEDPDTHNLIATFETTDNIYVYNVTKSKVDSSPLHPDRNGASAILTGTLSESYDEGDILVLCYNPEYIDDYGGDILFDYTNQNGTLAAVADFAEADKTVSAAEAAAKELSGTVSFTNLQSIFKFTFTDGSSAVPVQKVTISTAQGQLVQTDLCYHRFGGMYKGEIRVTPAGTTTEPVFVALRNDISTDDTFYFEIEDGSGHMYKGEKSAPAGKIVNGKFYTSTVTLTKVPKPTVTNTDNGAAVEPNYGNYGYLDAGSLTVSGTGEGYYFSWASQSFKSLTLSGASITCHSREPVSSSRSILNPIILEGDNYIITDADHAAVAYKSNFSGTEFSQFIKGNGTLTITASGTVGTKGFLNTYSTPVNVAASSGYILTVSDGTDNGDGTTTWVYTVRPAITATAANIAEAVAEFNTSDIPDLVLSITEDIATSLTITRSNGVIDLGGHTISSDMFIQNNVEGLSITIRNGTVSAGIDGKGGHSDYYAGTVILENLTVTSCVWNDGHAYVINGGTYNQIELDKSASTPGIITINDGFFGDIYRYVDRYGGSDDCSTFILYGGKYKYRNTTNKLDDWCPTGYSVKSNTDDDSATYPYLVSAD